MVNVQSPISKSSTSRVLVTSYVYLFPSSVNPHETNPLLQLQATFSCLPPLLITLRITGKF